MPKQDAPSSDEPVRPKLRLKRVLVPASERAAHAVLPPPPKVTPTPRELAVKIQRTVERELECAALWSVVVHEF